MATLAEVSGGTRPSSIQKNEGKSSNTSHMTVSTFHSFEGLFPGGSGVGFIFDRVRCSLVARPYPFTRKRILQQLVMSD